MRKSVNIALLLFSITAAWPLAASAQAPGMNGRGMPARTYAGLDGRSTVSPYLNMVGNTNLASYQTLVRPLIDEREEINRQWARIDQINQQLGGMPGEVTPPDANRTPTRGRGTSAVRFMHYSHFYGGR